MGPQKEDIYTEQSLFDLYQVKNEDVFRQWSFIYKAYSKQLQYPLSLRIQAFNKQIREI